MDKLRKLSMGEKMIGGAGVFLILDLLFIPWHRIEVSGFGFTVSSSRSAIESPNGLFGLLALLLAAALVARILIGEFTQVKLPELPITWARAEFIGVLAVAALLAVKLIVETTALAFGAWLALAAAAVMVYGGWLRDHQAAHPAAPAL
jgi:hypothetical protein